MARKTKSDTLKAAVGANQRGGNFVWPSEIFDLPEQADEMERVLIVADSTYRQRPPADWSDGEVIAIAEYALAVNNLSCAQTLLDTTGLMVMGGKNGDRPVRNPALELVQTCSQRVQSLSRRLGIVLTARELERQGKLNRQRVSGSSTQQLTNGADKDVSDLWDGIQ